MAGRGGYCGATRRIKQFGRRETGDGRRDTVHGVRIDRPMAIQYLRVGYISTGIRRPARKLYCVKEAYIGYDTIYEYTYMYTLTK